MIVNANDTNFAQEVLTNNVPTVVDFYTSWCSPCKLLSPTLEALDNEYAGRIKVVKVNAEEAMAVSDSYGVMTVPTVLMFTGGQPIDELTGAVSIDKLREFVEKYL